jgi:hypothetical protein
MTRLGLMTRLGVVLLGLSGSRPAHGVLQGAWAREGEQMGANFGHSVATAGDVNGDGFSDLIIGAPLFDAPSGNEGRALVYHGSAAGLSSANWTADGGDPGDDFGRSVACAGDINGDGYDDVLVGSPEDEAGPTAPNEGLAHLYLGSPAGLSGAPDWSVGSNQTRALLGYSVATAGDVNADGYDDFLIGAPYWDNADADAGRAWLFFGAADGVPVLAWSCEGTHPDEYLGYQVGTAGDVNGDGYDDVIISAWGDDHVYVFHGSPTGPSPTWDDSFASAVGSNFGFSVSTAGDTNGDGYADILIGWPDWGSNGEGRSIVFFGSAGGVASTSWNYENTEAGAAFGWSVACAGDVNGDGYSDIVIGSRSLSNGQTHEGRSRLFYGSVDGPQGTAVWIADGEQAFAYFGTSVAPAGDVNGDGYSDIAASGPQFDNPDVDEGRVAVWHGRGDSPGTLQEWLGEENQELAEYGHALDLGDFNGDGYSDIVVGTGKWDGAFEDTGRAFVYNGGDSAPSATADWTTDGADAGERFGDAVATAWDVNNDGYDDLLVGAPGFDGGRGAVHLFMGSAAGLGASAAWSAYGEAEGDAFGFAVSSAGDVNADGFADAIIGAATYSGDKPFEGAAYVYLGSPAGPAPTPVWKQVGGQSDASFGHAVAMAGDVNADGFSDVIVGAPRYDHAEDGEGAAFVYLGSPAGPEIAPNWMGESDESGAGYGFSVASAGDVNGDAYSDVIIGAPYSDVGSPGGGGVFVHLGASDGVETASYAERYASQAGSALGWSVASADLNNDGLSDIILGAPFVDNGQLDEGQVWAYPGPLTDFSLWFANDGNAPLAWHGTSVASGGDVTGDGFPDILSGAPGRENPHVHEGVVHLWPGNGFWAGASPGLAKGHGLDRRPRIRRADDASPVALFGTTDDLAALFKAHGRTPLGRDDVRLEVEVKRFGLPFNGAGTFVTGDHDTGSPVPGDGSRVDISQLATGLLDDTMYRWRARMVSDHPFWKHSPWFTHPGNDATELDFRSAEAATDVADAGRLPVAPALSGRPSPFSRVTTLTYRVAQGGPLTLAVFDVRGRLVRTLVDGEHVRPGAHDIRWEGTDEAGRRVPGGVYFIMAEMPDGVTTARVVVAR